MINLVDSYYQSSINYPQIIKAVIQRVRVFLTETLYADDPDIDEDGISPRVIIADIGSSEDEAIRQAAMYFGPNQLYPFTAYSLNDFEGNVDRRNTEASQAFYFSDELNSFVSAVPIKKELPIITFTNCADDFERIQKIFLKMSAIYTQIFAPLTINGVDYQYPVRIEILLSKGSYAHGFVEYLRMNKIYDLVHTFNLYFFDISLDTNIVPIDEMNSNLKNLSPIDISLSENEYSKTHTMSEIPVILSSDPSHGEENFPVENSIILNFNVTMDEKSVNDSVIINPFFEHKLFWDDDSKVLIINPDFNLSSGTLYSITIYDTARAFYVYDNMSEYELTFTTEA